MRTAIDKAGRVVIPASVRERVGFAAGTELEISVDEIFGRVAVHDLPAAERLPLLRACAQEGTAGGRIYDAHSAEVARAAGAGVIVTDNRRHFIAALRHGLRVETTAEFAASLKKRPRA